MTLQALEELASKGGVEGLDERRTAAQTLSVLTEPSLDDVKGFGRIRPPTLVPTLVPTL